MKPDLVVVVTEPLDPAALAWAETRCRIVHAPPVGDALSAALAEAHGLVVRTETVVGDALLRAAPRLRVIGRAGVGIETIDIAACRARGIRVVYTPGASTNAVAEYTLSLMLDGIRPRPALPGPVDLATWRRLRQVNAGERELGESTIGILGLGRIGTRVAELLRPFGARVLFTDLRTIGHAESAGAVAVPVESLFAEAHILTIHIDGRPSNRHFVGAHLCSLLRRDAVLINTARGMVIDSAALRAALVEQSARQAFLDVHDIEPPPPDHPLFGLANCRLLPHLASRSRAALAAMSWVIRDVIAVMENREPAFEATDPEKSGD